MVVGHLVGSQMDYRCLDLAQLMAIFDLRRYSYLVASMMQVDCFLVALHYRVVEGIDLVVVAVL